MSETHENRYIALFNEISKYQNDICRLQQLNEPWSLMEFLNYLSSLQGRAGAIVGEANYLKGELESEFIQQNIEDFHKLPPTKFSMMMNASLYKYKALCIAADRLESDITHIADNLRTEISFLKGEARLAPYQTH